MGQMALRRKVESSHCLSAPCSLNLFVHDPDIDALADIAEVVLGQQKALREAACPRYEPSVSQSSADGRHRRAALKACTDNQSRCILQQLKEKAQSSMHSAAVGCSVRRQGRNREGAAPVRQAVWDYFTNVALLLASLAFGSGVAGLVYCHSHTKLHGAFYR